ncbi:MAG: DNA polymerase III subunit delta [Methylobacteriaceae bacterium]|nr:DNA polymerase III subunit delta [Methylobacteriaceae bacterium]
MTAIRSGEADRFVARPPAETKLFLIHGSDSGLVRERARKLLQALVEDPADPFQLVALDGDELAGDPLRLADEANTIPLFGGRRAVHVELGGKNIVPAIEPLLKAPTESAVLIEAGALKRDHALRKLFEKERTAAAIECSPDSAADVQRLINDELKTAGLTLDDDARETLIALLGEDRLSTRSEISKLVLAAHGRARITLDDVETLVCDASTSAHDDAVLQAFSGDIESVPGAFERLMATGGEPSVVLAAALRYAVALHRARLAIESGQPIDQAMGLVFRSGVGFGKRGLIEKHLRAWSREKLFRTIRALADLVSRTRREQRIGAAMAERALMSIAEGAKR